MSDNSTESALIPARITICSFLVRAVKGAQYAKDLADVIFAKWQEKIMEEKRLLIEKHNLRKELLRFLKRRTAVRKYNASKPERLIGSCLLRFTAQNIYLKMRAAATLGKYFKCKDAEREIDEYWHNLQTMESLNKLIRVMPPHLTSRYIGLSSRFNSRK
jgi:hypothetical protein